MKLALAALLLFSSVPAAQAYESQSGYAKEQKCFKKVYRERYIPGTMKNPGYVKTERKRVRVPCEKMFGEDIWRQPAYEESYYPCLLYTSPSPRDRQKSRMPSSA